MRHAEPSFAAEVDSQPHWQSPWTWRHLATLVLMGVSLPIFFFAAIVAGVVALPVLLVLAIARTVQSARSGASTQRHPSPG